MKNTKVSKIRNQKTSKKVSSGEEISTQKTLNELMGIDHTTTYPGFKTAADYESFLNDLTSGGLHNECTKRSIIPNQSRKVLIAKLMQIYNTVYHQFNTKEVTQEAKRLDEQNNNSSAEGDAALLKIMRRGR